MFDGDNPHSCKKYNKNQATFYQQLIDGGIGENMCRKGTSGIPCEKGSTEYVTKICPEITYKFDYCFDWLSFPTPL